MSDVWYHGSPLRLDTLFDAEAGALGGRLSSGQDAQE